MALKHPIHEGLQTVLMLNGGDREQIIEWCELITSETGIQFKYSNYIGHRCIDCEKPFEEVEEYLLQYADRFPMVSQIDRFKFFLHSLPVRLVEVEGYGLTSVRDDSMEGMEFGEKFRAAYIATHGEEAVTGKEFR